VLKQLHERNAIGNDLQMDLGAHLPQNISKDVAVIFVIVSQYQAVVLLKAAPAAATGLALQMVTASNTTLIKNKPATC
jgi:hypothetical protein